MVVCKSLDVLNLCVKTGVVGVTPDDFEGSTGALGRRPHSEAIETWGCYTVWRHSAFHCTALIEHLHKGEGRHASRAAFRAEDALSSGRLNVP